MSQTKTFYKVFGGIVQTVLLTTEDECSKALADDWRETEEEARAVWEEKVYSITLLREEITFD
jgi:hypothetical protein